MGLKATTYDIAVGDLEPDIIHYILIGKTGEAQNLTGIDSVKFSLYNLDTSTLVEDENAASVVTAAEGKVKYEWGAAETDTAGRYVGWFTVYWTAGPADPMTPTGIEIIIKDPQDRITV